MSLCILVFGLSYYEMIHQVAIISVHGLCNLDTKNTKFGI